MPVVEARLGGERNLMKRRFQRQERLAKHQADFERIVTTVLEGPGTLDAALRRAAFNQGGGFDAPGHEPLPPELAGYVDKVARHAYRITDGDVEALRRAGWSEDQLFELTVAAAVGAGAHRLSVGLAALGRD